MVFNVRLEPKTTHTNIVARQSLLGQSRISNCYWFYDMLHKSRRYFLAVAMLVFVASIAWILSETWRWSNFPNTCPLNKHLPETAVAKKCEYAGWIDFRIEFEALSSRPEMDQFAASLMTELTNPEKNWKVSSYSYGNSRLDQNHMQIIADHEIQIDIHWVEGVMMVYYLKS